MIFYKALFDGFRGTCPYCDSIHRENKSCIIVCVYCLSIHKRCDLIDEMCPKMAIFAKKLQED